jgi:hypothetical protein
MWRLKNIRGAMAPPRYVIVGAQGVVSFFCPPPLFVTLDSSSYYSVGRILMSLFQVYEAPDALAPLSVWLLVSKLYKLEHELKQTRSAAG